ncbi:xylose isomerase (plasmid) [Fulvitalea axinellae]|uniref:Xylose isomerase n=2 Tax=Fulvitalea axinellae TaxID=1182444 RepID=A0AAU9CTE3_9BACT|nr:xylose isomerase [Fulvitalea axinellae]
MFAGLAALPNVGRSEKTADGKWFDISLAQWSVRKSIWAKTYSNLDFPERASKDYGINAVEYVTGFFESADPKYINKLKGRAADNGVRNLLIMVDGEGGLANTNGGERKKAVENHYKWIDAAKTLGCHSIRVNAYGKGSAEDVGSAAVDGLSSLSEYASQAGINVIVENHGGYSSNGEWLAGVMQKVNRRNVGTLPDFGNFRIGGGQTYDRYKGVAELMPYAKGVSAKSYDFDSLGRETKMDYYRLMKIVKDAGYRGHVGIEYEGKRLGEKEGILATKWLLEQCRGLLM